MLKWILIPIGVIILIIVAIVVALYVLIFVSKAPLARPITYESEEQAVAGAVSDMLEGLLGITLSESQEDDLEQLLIDFSSGDADISDIQAFILDDTTGVMATSTISLTGTRGVEINEVQLTALINLLIGNVDSFVDDANISSENGVLTYSKAITKILNFI